MADTVLLTGISGFIAKHQALRLLQAGYGVRGTLRRLDRADEVRAALVHMASPFVIDMPRDAQVLIRPAVQGTRRALGAAARAGVKRVVLTSSIVAIETPGGTRRWMRATGWT